MQTHGTLGRTAEVVRCKLAWGFRFRAAAIWAKTETPARLESYMSVTEGYIGSLRPFARNQLLASTGCAEAPPCSVETTLELGAPALWQQDRVRRKPRNLMQCGAARVHVVSVFHHQPPPSLNDPKPRQSDPSKQCVTAIFPCARSPNSQQHHAPKLSVDFN